MMGGAVLRGLAAGPAWRTTARSLAVGW